MLGEIRQALQAQRVTVDTLPEDLRRDWISDTGLVRVEVTPKGDSNDRVVMTEFAQAMQAIAPDASGPPVIVSEAQKTITRAFLEAGLYAFIAIFIILAVALRNPLDVALTLGPLVLAGIMSLQAADLLGMSLNFANIIALPLMFGVGVAFHIYYVIAWRKGVVDMLASSLNSRHLFQFSNDGHRIWKLDPVEPSRNREHGPTTRHCAVLHIARRLHYRAGVSWPAARPLDGCGGRGLTESAFRRSLL